MNSDYTATIPQIDQVWDWDRSFRCECDYGYTGIDCSDRLCPSGVDPVNPEDCAVESTGEEFFGSDQQVIRFPSDLPQYQWFYLEFESEFGGVPFRTHAIEYDPANSAKLAGDIQAALESLPNAALPSVQTRIVDDEVGYTGTVLVAFTDDATPGRQQLLQCFSPGPDDASAGCDGVFPKVESVNPNAVECETAYYNAESEIYSSYECSGRGECDRASGKCDCHSGFNGPRCETMFSFF